MKKILIGLAVLSLLLVVFQAWTYYSNRVEEQPYELITTLDGVEIRHYPPARMASVQMAPEQASSGNGFRVLAGYIFGGNEEEKKYAMTAPVHMSRSSSGSKMSFVLPEEHWNDELPTPNDHRVQLHWSEEQTVAVVQFSGYMNPETAKTNKDRLIATLEKHNVEHKGDFRSLGYDPPYKMVDRRNEIIVSIDRSTLPKNP